MAKRKKNKPTGVTAPIRLSCVKPDGSKYKVWTVTNDADHLNNLVAEGRATHA